MITCPKCGGQGWTWWDTLDDNTGYLKTDSADCDYCYTTGRISLFRWLMWWIGGKK